MKLNHDDLKAKFSALLDNFQDYVTNQEQASEQMANSQKDALLLQMQEQIRNLEQVTEQLQQELDNKENMFKHLSEENERLNKGADSTGVVASLQEEIAFLKRHYEIEIGLVKDQCEARVKESLVP